ncbi:unnamed protein product [Candida verbasci]|uniref:M7GpppX diphosphatase n=1 Tax=Candida verbasci TaxID=1227364 RepID=A0A9W4U111_9ASCO|nr:unnamed protein product [Candida verbasci]
MSINNLISQFRFTKLLKNDVQTKTIALLGTINSQNAIIIIEKSQFNEDSTNSLTSLISEISLINSNDIYYWSKIILSESINKNPSAKLNLIYPATETHISKYDDQKLHMIKETPEMYINYVVPYIDSMKGERLKWVYNILFHGKESETFIYHDKSPSGFVLLPDMKWDMLNLTNLYLCCIVNRMDISNVRDLNGVDVDYLKNIREKIYDVTKERFGLERDELRLFVHYQPSYYHFHVHVVNVKHPGLGDGISVGKAILLDDMIDNLMIDSDYYKRKTLNYVIGENHGIWKIEEYRNAANEASKR